MSDHRAAYYRAEIARVLARAEEATDQEARDALLEIAKHYERLAAWAQRRQEGE